MEVQMSERPTNPIWIKVITDDDSLIPAYQTSGSAGCDLRSTDNVVIPSGSRLVVGTGLKLEIPHGFAAQVCPRSGLAAKNGITVLNAPGIIDCFSEESVISTISGKKKVHDIMINEAIFSFNEATLEIEKDIVTAIVDVGVKDVIVFTLENAQKLSVTPGTVVYTADGPKKAKDIIETDQIAFDHDI
jgi:deoxyuridine 5'-triphosphate nucleotidohydrolase